MHTVHHSVLNLASTRRSPTPPYAMRMHWPRSLTCGVARDGRGQRGALPLTEILAEAGRSQESIGDCRDMFTCAGCCMATQVCLFVRCGAWRDADGTCKITNVLTCCVQPKASDMHGQGGIRPTHLRVMVLPAVACADESIEQRFDTAADDGVQVLVLSPTTHHCLSLPSPTSTAAIIIYGLRPHHLLWPVLFACCCLNNPPHVFEDAATADARIYELRTESDDSNGLIEHCPSDPLLPPLLPPPFADTTTTNHNGTNGPHAANDDARLGTGVRTCTIAPHRRSPICGIKTRTRAVMYAAVVVSEAHCLW
jgi:hypothetical protein